MKIVDTVLNDFITMKTSQKADMNSSNDKNYRIKYFYEKQIWSNYNINEKHLNAIVKKNVTPVDHRSKNFHLP